MWYHRVIGGGRCPVVDTWWQTETGAIMISPLPGATPTVPGSATRPLPGIVPEVVTRDGKPVGDNQGGFLVIKQPWPSMLRTLYGDDERYRADHTGARSPAATSPATAPAGTRTGNYWIMGRVDDVLNVSGHRLSTMEVESALVSHPKVAEAAVVGKPDELRGQAIAAFVTLESGADAQRRAAAGAARPRRQGDRRPGPARRHPVHRLPAQDPQRQDHAPAPPRHRRRPREHRRHHDPRRPGRPGQAPRGGRS